MCIGYVMKLSSIYNIIGDKIISNTNDIYFLKE
jgi:hypothetical protein